MKRHRLPPVRDLHPNVTALIDVTMCLVIFFMLVARIGVATGAEPMNLPATLMGVDIRSFGNTLILNVRHGPGDDPEITALVGGAREELAIAPGPGRTVLVDVLRAYRFGPDGRPGGRDDNPGFSIIIRAEEGLEYRFLEPVLTAAAQASVTQVAFTTRRVTVAAPDRP